MTADQSAARDELAARLARLGLPGGGVKGRQAALPSAMKTLHRRLLSAFLTEPGVSDPAVVAGLAAKLGLEPRRRLRPWPPPTWSTPTRPPAGSASPIRSPGARPRTG